MATLTPQVKVVNAELQRLCDEDQADRRDVSVGDEVGQRDRERRRRVAELLDAGEARDGVDFFNAALIFQHGETLEEYEQAHTLARRAADLGHRPGRALAAAAYDRWLMRQGKRQKYGTQFLPGGDQWTLWPVDPSTTDAERVAWDVPPPEEARRRLEEAYGPPPPLDRDRLPPWLREAMQALGM
jgi:TPR repeat protein